MAPFFLVSGVRCQVSGERGQRSKDRYKKGIDAIQGDIFKWGHRRLIE
jgi:hypothetical protein